MTARTFTPRADGQIIQAAHVNAVQDGVAALSVVTAKGDLIVGDEAGVEARLAVGLDGLTLVANSLAASGLAYESPRPHYHERLMQLLANAGVNTLTNLGFTAAPTATGAATNVDDASGPFVNYASGAVSGNVGGLNSAATVCRGDWLPRFVTRVKLPATITTARFWAGLFSAAPTASATPAGHLAGFRYDTVADGTAFWRCCTDDNGAAPTVTVTTVAVTAGAVYMFRIVFGPTTVWFYINNVLVAAHTTDLPSMTTMLSWYATVTTLSAAARSMAVSRIGLSHV